MRIYNPHNRSITAVAAVTVLSLLGSLALLSTPAAAGYDSAKNDPAYWGEGCYKIDRSGTSTWVSDGDYRLVVLKSARDNDVFTNVRAGDVLRTVSGKDISHRILCPPVETPPTTTAPPTTVAPPTTTVAPPTTTVAPPTTTVAPPTTTEAPTTTTTVAPPTTTLAPPTTTEAPTTTTTVAPPTTTVAPPTTTVVPTTTEAPPTTTTVPPGTVTEATTTTVVPTTTEAPPTTTTEPPGTVTEATTTTTVATTTTVDDGGSPQGSVPSSDPDPEASDSPAPGLAFTGVTARATLVLANALMLIGFGFLVAARRARENALELAPIEE